MYWHLVDLNSCYSRGKNTEKYTQQATNRPAKILFPRDRSVINIKKAHISKFWDLGINTFLGLFKIFKWNDPRYQHIPRIL